MVEVLFQSVNTLDVETIAVRVFLTRNVSFVWSFIIQRTCSANCVGSSTLKLAHPVNCVGSFALKLGHPVNCVCSFTLKLGHPVSVSVVPLALLALVALPSLGELSSGPGCLAASCSERPSAAQRARLNTTLWVLAWARRIHPFAACARSSPESFRLVSTTRDHHHQSSVSLSETGCHRVYPRRWFPRSHHSCARSSCPGLSHRFRFDVLHDWPRRLCRCLRGH